MPVIVIEPDELQQLIRRAVAEEVHAAVSQEITRILSTPESDRLVSRRELMSELGIKSRDTVNKLERSGDLTPIRIGGKVSYRLANLQDLKKRRSG